MNATSTCSADLYDIVASLPEGPSIKKSLGPRKRKFAPDSTFKLLRVPLNFFFRLASLVLLRLESPSGMCPKLRTMATSNNRVHAPQSLCYCLFTPRIHIVVLRAHPLRGESHIQRNATEEVATTSPQGRINHLANRANARGLALEYQNIPLLVFHYFRLITTRKIV